MSCTRETVRGLGGRAIRAAERAALAGESRGHVGASGGASWLRAADGGRSGPMESAARGGSGWGAAPEAPRVVRWSKLPLHN